MESPKTKKQTHKCHTGSTNTIVYLCQCVLRENQCFS